MCTAVVASRYGIVNLYPINARLYAFLDADITKVVDAMATKEELTAFVNEVTVILEEEVASGRLTQGECCDYIQLLLHASQHIFKNKPEYHQEVLKVTKPLIKLPSVELRETWKALEKAQAELADRNAELADRDAENARLRKLLFEQGIPVPQS